MPHTSRLFADYLAQSPNLNPFYPSFQLQTNPHLEYPAVMRSRVSAILDRQNRKFGSSAAALENIERLRRGAYAVVSGQQVGLFGGPLLAVLKAAHAVKLARDLTQEGIETVPVFWMASEDHDLAEVNHVFLPGSDFGLQRLTAEVEGVTGATVSNLRFTKQIHDVLREAAELLGDNNGVDLLRECYQENNSVSDSFGKLFAKWFAKHGLVLLDPADAELHQLAEPLFRRAVAEAAEISRALQERGKALEQAGYHEQVKVSSSSVLLFAIQEGQRVPISRQNGNFTIGHEKLTHDQLIIRVQQEPENFNANVLLRPVLQDTLLPTLAYIGGPAEVAYFAQASVVYQRLLGRTTPILPRFSATLVEPKIEKLLEKYNFAFEDLYHGVDELAEKLALKTLPPELDERFRTALTAMAASMGEVKLSLAKLDSTLTEAADRAASKMRYQVGRLHRRAARAALRRTQILAQHAAQVSDALYPEKELQERTVGAAYFLSKYGLELVDTLVEAAGSCPEHRVIRL